MFQHIDQHSRVQEYLGGVREQARVDALVRRSRSPRHATAMVTGPRRLRAQVAALFRTLSEWLEPATEQCPDPR